MEQFSDNHNLVKRTQSAFNFNFGLGLNIMLVRPIRSEKASIIAFNDAMMNFEISHNARFAFKVDLDLTISLRLSIQSNLHFFDLLWNFLDSEQFVQHIYVYNWHNILSRCSGFVVG